MAVEAAMAAVFAAAAFAIVALRVAHPRRAPGPRMSLYLEVPRMHLGGPPGRTPGPLLPGEAVRRVLGPLGSRALRVLELILRAGTAQDLELRLRQAGLSISPEVYRRQYFRWLVGTPVVLGTLGAMTGKGLYVVLFFLAGLFAGARRLPEQLKAKSKARNERMRGDLPTVACVLAMKIDSNKSLVVAVSDVVAQGSGPVVEDLAKALHLINAGFGEVPAFELIAAESAEPAATRFYKFLATALVGGLDLGRALLDQANEMRAQRREEVERSSARRQMSLVVPNLVFMAPVLFLFLLAPLPQLLFGK